MRKVKKLTTEARRKSCLIYKSLNKSLFEAGQKQKLATKDTEEKQRSQRKIWGKQVTKIPRKLQRILGILAQRAQRKDLEILLKKQDLLLDSYWRNSEHKQFNIFRLSLSPVILSQPDRRRREGAVEGPRSDSDDHAASGSSHETLLNSFASVAPFAVKFQISLASVLTKN